MSRRLIVICSSVVLAMAVTVGCQPPGGGGGGEGGEGGGDGELFVTLATGGQSGNYYPIGAALAGVYEDELGATTTVEATGASVDNINLLDQGRVEMALIQADAADQAYNGEAPFEGTVDSFSTVASLYPQYVQVVATAASGIETMEDLEGATVSVGAPNSGVELNARTVTDAFGLSYDDFSPEYLSYSETIEGMQNGNIDAGFFTSGIPNPSVTELATSEDIVVVPIEGEGLDTLLSDYNYFEETPIPADSYDTDGDIPGVSFGNLLVVSNETDEETVYDLTSALWDNVEEIQGTNSAAEEISLDTAQESVPIDMHPGAERYYSENE
ncbi:TAXI family TRAP transporter solute-binding subunit [soil metagenome]